MPFYTESTEAECFEAEQELLFDVRFQQMDREIRKMMEEDKLKGAKNTEQQVRPDTSCKGEKMDICFWEEVDTGDYYESGCNKTGFQFNDGSPYDNGFKFCPYCGKQLKIKEPIFDESDI